MTLDVKPYNERLYRVFRDRRKPRATGFPDEDSDALETDIEHALSNFDFCWSNAYSEQSRFSDGNWAVLYTAEDCKTAVTEVTYHLDRTFGTGYDDGEIMTFKLVQYSMQLETDIVCFESSDTETQRKLTSEDYNYTNGVANKARTQANAMRSLSARRHTSFCVPIFSDGPVELRDVANTIVVEMERGGREFTSEREGTVVDLTIEKVSADL